MTEAEVTLDDVYEDALELMAGVGARPDVPLESREFVEAFIAGFRGTREELLAELRRRSVEWFRSLSGVPHWLQEPEWQFNEGRPMIFVGQVDIGKGSGLFHDDAAIFVFFDPVEGETKTVIQVS
jgi:hypothetical protein